MTETAARDGDAGAMLTLGRELLETGNRAKGEWWLTRAAELGLVDAQIRLADLLADDGGRDEAAWWLAAARAVNPARRMVEQGWSVVSTPSGGPAPLLPVAELEFDDLARIGPAAMLTLLRQTDKDDWVWALAPDGNDVSPRLRHFVLGCLRERAASLLMRDMLAADLEGNRLRTADAKHPILNALCDLCDDGMVALADDLARELWQRQSVMPMPSDGGPYDFSGHRKAFANAHERLAGRPARGNPMPVPPPHGWYTDTLGQQSNATIRAVLAGTGERALCCYLSGCPSFTRFRFWQVSSAVVRWRLVDADDGYGIGADDRTHGQAEMDALLADWHRAGRIGWWKPLCP